MHGIVNLVLPPAPGLKKKKLLGLDSRNGWPCLPPRTVMLSFITADRSRSPPVENVPVALFEQDEMDSMNLLLQLMANLNHHPGAVSCPTL